MAIRIVTLPAPFEFTPKMLSNNAYYFTEFVLGRLPLMENNYTEIEPPADLSGYAIANLQDFYLTSPSPEYVISLFLNTPSTFFSEFDNYHEVTAVDKLRLDLISYKYYLQVEYWWVIALANNILDPFNIPIGTILRVPSESTVINEWLHRPLKRVRDPNAFFFGTR